MDISCDHKIDKNKQEIKNFWCDVPQDILVLIFNKLHNDFADLVRFRAVCKNWRIPEELMSRRLDLFPWVTNYSWLNNSTLEYELFRPYSQKLYKVSNAPIEKSKNTYTLMVYATKHGWLLYGEEHTLSLFLHNPFINKTISLPKLKYYCKAATFTNVPTSQHCQVFVFWNPLHDAAHISTYCFSTKLHWSSQFLEIAPNEILCLEYSKGSVYCLFEKWVLKRYNLADKSWQTLTTNPPKDYFPRYIIYKCWLIEKGEDLVVACAEYNWYIENWIIFRFDSSEMSWVVETSLTGCAFFISGGISFSLPFADCDGKEIEDCKVFYFELKRDRFGIDSYYFNCFSLKENRINSRNYSWIKERLSPNFSFVDPPRRCVTN